MFSPEVKDPGNHSFYDWTKSPGAEKLYHYSSPTATPVLETFNITYAFSDSTVSGYIVAEPVSCYPRRSCAIGAEGVFAE